MNASESAPSIEGAHPVPVRRLLLPGVLGVFLLLQVAIPILQLGGVQPSQFSWQMFANKRPIPTYAVVLTDGSELSIDLNDYVGRYRGDLDYRARVPPFLCQAIADAIIIREYALENGAVTEVSCR